MQAYASDSAEAAFAASYTRFDGLVAWLAGGQAAGMTHAELEERLHTDGLALLRQLLQDSLDLRAVWEERLADVVDVEGHRRGRAEGGHGRGLATRFGQVSVARIAYRARGRINLHPADAALNLPVEKHSHGLRKLAALEAARGSFADAAAAIGRATGVRLGRRQVEELAARAATDVDGFYTAHVPEPAPDGDALVLSFDAKGVVMRRRTAHLKRRRSAAVRTQSVADASYGFDPRLSERLVDLAAKCADVHLDEVDVGVVGGVFPDGVQDVALAHRVADVVGEVDQHSEFAGSQGDVLSCAAAPVGGRIDLEIAEMPYDLPVRAGPAH